MADAVGAGFQCKLCRCTQKKQSYLLSDKARLVQAAKCSDCGLFQVVYDWTQAGTIESTSAFDQYSTDATWHSDAEMEAHRAKAAVFAAMLAKRGLVAGARVLEVGCGQGFFLEACRRAGAASVAGLEFRNLDIEHARRTLGIPDVTPTSVSQMRGEFDLVCSFDVLEHVHDLAEFFEHCVRLTKPGGYMVHATPGVDSVSHRTGRLAARIGFRSAGRVLTNVQYVSNLLGGPHVSILGREQIRWLCRRYGLTAIETEYVSSYSFSNRHYAKVVPGLSTLPAPVGAALFGLVRATIKNKLLLIARKQ